MTLFEWMSQWRQPGDDEQVVRSYLGRLLFSQKDIDKSMKVISGGEQGRMLFGKIMMHKPNVLVMDEPTNHLDMESIESLNTALENYPGTLIFVSHDREIVSSLATRIIELTTEGVTTFSGSYDEYLLSQGVAESQAHHCFGNVVCIDQLNPFRLKVLPKEGGFTGTIATNQHP